MYAKLTTTKSAFNDWICTAIHKRWWKAEWTDTRIELKCELCGRIY